MARDEEGGLGDILRSTAPRLLRNRPRLSLLVIGEGISASHTLPESGDVVLGRQPDCDIVIDDPSLSRRHVVLHLDAPRTVEDLGSANGTRLRDVPLTPRTPAPLAPGDVIDVGTMMVILQERSAEVRPRRVWAHTDFEARLHEECARTARTGTSFAMLSAHCPEAGEALLETLEGDIRAADVLGQYGPGDYEVILVELDPAEAEAVVARIGKAVMARWPGARVGASHHPRDGRDPFSLLAVARAAAKGDHSVTPVPPRATEGAMQNLRRLVEHVSAGNISVLVLGETGVGKELLAETIHRSSPRALAPFLRLNCAALTESLLESELFGHERGAFTGAVAAKPGLLESANGGTVFLDEVGEMPLSTQAKLLRVLENRQVLRVGALTPRPIDVRFVAATNRDLEEEIARKHFRQDLFFRLNGITLVIPPLRQRVDEILPVAQRFVAQFCADAARAPLALSDEAVVLLRRYAWPGNIRELRNVIERAVLLCRGDAILPEHLPLERMRPAPAAPAAPTPPRLVAPPAPAAGPRLPGELEALEKRRIVEALERCAGNQTHAAEILGISRRTLVSKLARFDIPRPRKRHGY